jgi:amino acid adenylation domain-containing protein
MLPPASGIRYALTAQQASILAHEQWSQAQPPYNLAVSAHMQAAVSPAIFQRAFQCLVDEADALRSIILPESGQQCVLPALRAELPIRRAASLEEALGAGEALARQPLDLSARGFAAALYLLPDETSLFAISHHHIFTDSRGMENLLARLCSLYDQIARGTPPLPGLPAFAAALEEEAAYQASRAAAAERAWWEAKLAACPPPLALYGQPPARRAPAPARLPVPLGEARAAGLWRLARALPNAAANPSVALANLSLTLLVSLLYRASGYAQFAVGLAAHGRPPAHRHTIGHFVRRVPLLLETFPSDTFASLHARIAAAARAALRRQRHPAERLLPRPYDAVLNFHPAAPSPRLASQPVRVHWHLPAAGRSPLVLNLRADAPTLELSLEFQGAATPPAQQERAAAHLAALLDALLADPHQPAHRVDILTPAERRLTLPGSRPEPPAPRLVPARFEAQAAASPQAIAVEMDETRWTYAELAERARRTAHALHAAGLRPGDPVGVLQRRSPALVSAMLGAWLAGGVYLPLEPAHPPARHAHLLRAAGARFLIAGEGFEGHAPSGTRIIPAAAGGMHHPSIPPAALEPGSPACLLFTSGSTGEPKGVVIPHGALARHIEAVIAAYGLSPADCVLQFASPGFDTSLEQTLGALLAGARLALRGDELWDAGELRRRIARHGITVANLPTAYWNQVAAAWLGKPALPAHLRLWLIGGEAMPAARAGQWLAAGISAGELWNVYGPTEALITATAFACRPGFAGGSVPIGRALPGRVAAVRDPQGLPCPIHVPGELYLGGETLAAGYLGDEALTAARFVELEGTRWFCTGDQARWLEDGSLEFLGRLDGQVKIAGVRVEPRELENLLLRHPGVQAAAVATAGAPDAPYLAAWVVPAGEGVERAALLTHARAHLPAALVPRALTLLESLPLTANGKLDWSALPAPHAEPAARPPTPLEARLVQVWREILPARRASIGDDFFALGGSSLDAVRLFGQIEAATGVRLPPDTLLEAPTIELLAARIQAGRRAPPPLVVRLREGVGSPPFFCVHGFGGGVLGYTGLSQGLPPGQPFYALRAEGVDGGQPDASIEAMAARYLASLRAVQPGGPYLLGGYCFGGVIAFEMARRLREAGERVGLLAIFEGYAPLPRAGRRALWRSPRAIAYLLRNLAYLASDYFRYREAGRLPPAPPDETLPGWQQDLFRLHAAALRQYTPQAYAGEAVLFHVRRGSLRLNPAPARGWDQIVRGGVRIRQIEGAHFNFLEAPYVASLAAALGEELLAAQQGGRQA